MGDAPSIPKYEAQKMPKFQQANVEQLHGQSIDYDKQGYALTDDDYAKRFPELVEAQKLYRNQVLADQQRGVGEGEMSDDIHNELLRSGISSSIGAFGGGSIQPGSAGEAAVARHLGMGVMDYQDRMMNRENTRRTWNNQNMAVSSQLFQPRQFGFGGEGALQLSLANLAGQNNWNQANYASQVQAGQFNSGIAAQNQNAKIQSGNSTMGAIGSAASAAAIAATACWVAREVYGPRNPKWKQFRRWLFTKAPKSFALWYLKNGKAVSERISNKPIIKAIIRSGMNLVTA